MADVGAGGRTGTHSITGGDLVCGTNFHHKLPESVTTGATATRMCVNTVTRVAGGYEVPLENVI